MAVRTTKAKPAARAKAPAGRGKAKRALRLDAQAALIYAMVLTAASDRRMPTAETRKMGEIIRGLPVFGRYDVASLAGTVRDCTALLQHADGLDAALGAIEGTVQGRLRETAYALACEVAASDGRVSQEEARFLEMLRDRLELGKLVAAAIERGIAARYRTR